MTITNALASVPVKDLKSSMKWYERLFGRPADAAPMPEVAEWKFSGGGWLQVYELGQRAGAGSVTLAVRDLEDQVEKMRRLGIEVKRPMASSRMKVVMVKDPDGNSIAFAETAQ